MVRIGDALPPFALPLARPDGRKDPVSLGDLLGKGPVVIAFFPLAFSGVCTAQLCALRDRHADLDALDATVVGFSIDAPHTNVAYARAHALRHGIFSDPNREVVDGIWETATVAGVRRVAKRGWLVLDRAGTVVAKWVTDDPEVWPGVAPLVEAVRAARGA